MRLTKEQLQNVKQKYNVSRLWSWSMINTYLTSPYEYYLKYILHKPEDRQDCSYATLGSICHSIIEDFYNKKILANEMCSLFDDGWTTAIDIAELKFDRNNESKNESISKKYYEDLHHFFKNHTAINQNLLLERFVATKIGDNVLQGYIDAVYKDSDGVYTIIDWKTSTKYSGNDVENKAGQLVVYAISLLQSGVPIDKIRICWNFLKYVSVSYQLKNGDKKSKHVERYKTGESIQSNAKTWLKEYGYADQTDEILKQLIDTNDITVLPEEIQTKFTVSDCYVYVPLNEDLVRNWENKISQAISEIEFKELEYATSQDERVFWDSEKSVETQSYYFATLSGYSSKIHVPYRMFLERLETRKTGGDIFCNLGNDLE